MKQDDPLETLYDPSRRVSRWLVVVMALPLFDDVQRRDVFDWLEALPAGWWARFQDDDAPEDRPHR